MSGIAYIQGLPHASENQLKPIQAKKFHKALEATFGKDVNLKTTAYLTSTMPEVFSGVPAFKARYFEALKENKPISVADQKYIADTTKHVALGILVLN